MLFTVITALIIPAGALYLVLRKSARQQRTIDQSDVRIAEQTKLRRDFTFDKELTFATNPHPMWVYDCETLRFLEVNDAAVNIYGYSRKELLTMTLLDIRPPDEASAFREVARERHAGYSNAGLWRHRYKDGTIVLVEIMAFEFQADGHPRELILTSNVTERCHMEEALRESEALLQSLVNNAPFGIAQSLLDGNGFKTLNPAMRKILGDYTLAEALKLDIPTQVYCDPRDRNRLTDVLRRSGTIQGWETTLRRRDGGTVPVRVTGTLSGGTCGTPEVFSSYIEDLTQQSALERQIQQVQKLEAVGRLAGGMAHDFNNILLVIKLSTELILGQVLPDSPYTKALLQISNAADRAAALTRQMLAFGRQQIMQARIICVNKVVSETSQMLQRVIGEDINLVTNLSDVVEHSLLDPDQVTQVILNLAVNARDAMPEGGTLHIETAMVELDEGYTKEHPPVQPGRYVMLAVSDTGSGIDKSILPRIFDPFFTTKEVGKGTGLGLSIVYGIVKQSGGYIWVYSELGRGTTFKLYFPATTAALARPALHREAMACPSGEVLLVVEDDAGIRSNVCECLQQLGYHVIGAEGASAALEMCEELRGKIDLVLTDLVMAGRTGHQLASELAIRYPAIRVLFMSGYTEDSATLREILLKGSPFLQKPFSVADLSRAVHDALVMASLAC